MITQTICHILLYYEEFQQIEDAIAREKELKGWSRSKIYVSICNGMDKRVNALLEIPNGLSYIISNNLIDTIFKQRRK